MIFRKYGYLWFGSGVLNLSVPDLFLVRICSAKYNTALRSLLNIFEKARDIQYLTLRRAAKIQYVYIRTKFEHTRKDSTALNSFRIYNS